MSTAAEGMGPAPALDADNAFFWEGLRESELRLQRCVGCSRHRFPPLPACPYCGDARSAVDTSPGRGTLYSWVVVHRAFSDAFSADVPYTVGVVELDEGCRVLARLELSGQPPAAGLPLAAGYREHPADGKAWTELYFHALDASGASGREGNAA